MVTEKSISADDADIRLSPFSQWTPEKPVLQTQSYPPTLSEHMAPFLQGFVTHWSPSEQVSRPVEDCDVLIKKTVQQLNYLFIKSLTNVDGPEEILQDNTCKMSLHLFWRYFGGLNHKNEEAADRSVRVLEESPGLLVRAHFLHANLLQGGAGGVPLLAVDQRARLLLVQEHCVEERVHVSNGSSTTDRSTDLRWSLFGFIDSAAC